MQKEKSDSEKGQRKRENRWGVEKEKNSKRAEKNLILQEGGFVKSSDK